MHAFYPVAFLLHRARSFLLQKKREGKREKLRRKDEKN
jgi:hypothetical protein